MAQFKVKVLDANLLPAELMLEAANESDIHQQMEARGVAVLSVSRSATLPGAGNKRFPLQLFCEELLALLQSGLPLVESIETLAERQTSSKTRRPVVRGTLDALCEGLRNGQTFSAVLQSQRGIFPELFIAMVRASERTSDLDQALVRYVAYREQTDALRTKIVSAAIYPVTLLCVGGLVVLFLLGYVVPRFAGVFEESGSKLPFASRMLLDWGKLISGHAAIMGGAAIVAIAFAIYIARMPATRAMVSRWLWALPTVGERLKVFQLARFYRTLSMLLRGGIPAIQAMQMARDLLASALRDKLDAAIAQVREGRSLSDTLTAHELTTNVAQRLLRVGEKSGNLGDMAERVATFHEGEIARWVDWLTRLIGPLLMLVIGSVIGLIVVLMYLPIFQLAESIQ